MSRVKFFWRLCFSLLLGLCTACATPVPDEDIQPGHRPALDTDEAGLWMMMDRYEKSLKTSGKVDIEPGLNGYIQDIACRLSEEHCGDIRVYVMRNAGFNASMAPNGVMTVWTGLLLRCENEAQIAYIMGHEIAHYLRRHSLRRWRDIRAKTTAIGFASIVAVAGGSPAQLGALLATYGMAASIFAYTRDNEREADRYGFQLYTEAGYAPAEAARIWERLEQEAEAGDWPEPPLFFETHPDTEERSANMRALAQAAAPSDQYRTNADRYLSETLRFRDEWLRDELRQRNFGSMQFTLDRLLEQKYGHGLIHYYQGELYQLRDEDGDDRKAIVAFREALEYQDAPPEAHRELGFVLWDSGDEAGARAAFEAYLKAQPFAGDRPMIESYLEELT